MQGVDFLNGPLRAAIVKRIPVNRTPRVQQVEGLFDLAAAPDSVVRWDVSLPLHERPWAIGAIIGASGTGKTTIARSLFGESLVSGFDWPENKSVLDAFPAGMSIVEITMLLSSVGFSSPPSWLRPFHVLSTGEQFRVTIARALAEQHDLVAIDEFTSVVDRTVAQIGSAAVAHAVRATHRRLVAISCHFDIINWLQPDWLYEPATNLFTWRGLQRRPSIALEIRAVHRSAWNLFRQYHYLSADLHRSAACFVGFVNGEPAVFSGVLSFPHSVRPGWREHRTVCRPDFQGVGIGNAMSEFIAGCYRARGRPYFSTTSHPAMIRHRAKSRLWAMRGSPRRNPPHSGIIGWNASSSHRLTAGFEYVGPRHTEEAQLLGICRPC